MTNLLSNTQIEKVSRTRFTSEPIIYQGQEVNKELLEAITSIPYVKRFGLGTVSFQEGIVFKTMDGYVYRKDKEEEEFEVLVVCQEKTKEFKVYAAPDVNQANILQAVLLTNMDVKYVGIQMEDAYSVVPTVILDETSEGWEQLAQYVLGLQSEFNLLQDNTEVDTTFFNRKRPTVSDDDIEDIIEEYFEDVELEESSEGETVELDIETVGIGSEVDQIEAMQSSISSTLGSVGISSWNVQDDNQVNDQEEEENADDQEVATATNEGDYASLETLQLYDLLKDNGITLQEMVDATGVSMSVLSQYGNRKKMPKKVSTIKKVRNGLISIALRTDFSVVTPPQAQTVSSVQVKQVTQPVKPVQQEEKPKVQKVRLPINEDKVREENPAFFSDLLKRRYLDQFADLTDKVKDRVIRMAKYNRERLVERFGLAIVEDIPSKGKYMGDTLPIKVAISTVLSMRHLAITGPSGCGKSTLVETIAWLFNLPLFKIDGNNSVGQDSYLGQRTFDENGDIAILDGMLIKAMDIGAIFYFDEMNMTRGSSVSKTNGALDKQRKILNELKAETQKADENFRCFVSFNPDYEDTNPVNRATNDRVERLMMDYMDQQHLYTFVRRIGEEFTSYQREVLELQELDREAVNNIVQIAQALQDKNNGLTTEVSSLRNIEAIYEHVAGGVLDLAEATRIVIDKFGDQKSQILDALVEIEALGITDDELEEARAS